MLLIDQVDLEERGIQCQGVSEFVFLDKCFQKGQTFENSQRERAIASCRQMLDAGLMSLIVNYQSHFTIWVETAAAPAPMPSSAPSADLQNNHGAEESPSDPSRKYQKLMAKLNEPVDIKAVMTKLNEPISLKSLFSKGQGSQSEDN